MLHRSTCEGNPEQSTRTRSLSATLSSLQDEGISCRPHSHRAHQPSSVSCVWSRLNRSYSTERHNVRIKWPPSSKCPILLIIASDCPRGGWQRFTDTDYRCSATHFSPPASATVSCFHRQHSMSPQSIPGSPPVPASAHGASSNHKPPRKSPRELPLCITQVRARETGTSQCAVAAMACLARITLRMVSR